MRLLIYSRDFYPSCGGVEDVTFMTCNELTKLGCVITLITKTSCDKSDCQYPFRVMRNPNAFAVIKAYLNCDVFIHEVLSLKMIYPLLFNFKKRKWVCVHHQVELPNSIKTMIKKYLMRYCYNIAVSETTAEGYGLRKYHVIYNAYDPAIFYNNNPEIDKRIDFVYLGRIHSDKGIDILMNAFIELKRKSSTLWKLNIIGSGDAEYVESLKQTACKSGYSDDIIFWGYKSHKDAAQILNKCKVGIVPSTYKEAFGLTVLQLMACGCYVIGSDGDGISEVLGGTGMLFKKKSENDLLQSLENVINMDMSAYVKNNLAQLDRLKQFVPPQFGANYYSFLKSIIEK